MKRMICIAGSVGLLLMASSAYGQNFQSVLKQNMELKSEISNLKGELATKNSTIKRLKDMLADRNAEIRELKSKLRKFGGDPKEDIEKYKNRQVPKDVLNKALLKALGPTSRQGVDRVWRINYFPIGPSPNVGRTKTCLSVDWSLNDISQAGNEAVAIIKTISELTERFDYLILRTTAARVDKFGRMEEFMPHQQTSPPISISNPLVLKKDDILKISWASFESANFRKLCLVNKGGGAINGGDSRDMGAIISTMNRDRRFELLPKTR